MTRPHDPVGALRRYLLPYAAELRHWFGLGLDDCCAMGTDELEVIMQSLLAMPAPGWSISLHGDPSQMPEPGRQVLFVEDFTKGR